MSAIASAVLGRECRQVAQGGDRGRILVFLLLGVELAWNEPRLADPTIVCGLIHLRRHGKEPQVLVHATRKRWCFVREPRLDLLAIKNERRYRPTPRIR